MNPADLPPIDRAAYRERMQMAVIEAVMNASMVKDAAGNHVLDENGQKVCAMVSDIIADVLLLQIAYTLIGSPSCASPTKTRETCDAFAKKLRRHINEGKQVGTGVNHYTVEVDEL